MLDVSAIREYLASFKNRPEQHSLESIEKSLVSLKVGAVTANDQTAAKEIWCLQEALRAQTLFLTAFDLMKDESFYNAWCALEQAELALSRLEHHHRQDWPTFHLDFIHGYIPKWQALFPYKLFLSPEYLKHEEKCSICGTVVTSPRIQCGHEVGEIYDGDMCCRLVSDAEVLAVAFVENPVQKYSVPFAGSPTKAATAQIIMTTGSCDTRCTVSGVHLIPGA